MRRLRARKQPASLLARNILAMSATLLLVIGSAPLVTSSAISSGRTPGLPTRPAANVTGTVNEAYPWDADTQTTAPISDTFGPDSPPLQVSPLFASYYHSRSGAISLGVPVTPAFPIGQGWIQFFASGALLLPTAQRKHVPDPQEPQDALVALIDAGERDPSAGIIRLPLLQALLTAGSQAQLVDGGSLSYVDLRAATNIDTMVFATSKTSAAMSSQVSDQSVFIKEGTRAGKAVGHLVPSPIWSYIQQADVSPDGWAVDFGPPLTEALPIPVSRNGSIHHLLIQAFWEDAVVLDQGPSGDPSASLLETGVAYLRTIGPPPVAIVPQQAVWAQADTAVMSAPGTGPAVAQVAPLAHIGRNFSLALLGDSAWNSGMLWYHVQWTTPRRAFSGWVAASSFTFTSPGDAPGWASIDALSPDLAAYLAGMGGSVGVAVYDVTRQRYYTSGADGQFITGSSVKVPIMLTLLDLTEREGREPNDNEMQLLTTMIENSNNDSAAALYYGEVGGANGVGSYLQGIGISSLDLDPDAFGWSLITPMAMVNLLTKLHNGDILTASDRQLALSLMEQIEPDQQIGVGDTAPAGSSVAMKDGWVVGPDGLWTMNSSGMVTLGQETYIIAVYTQDQNALEDGQAIAQHVCGTVASLLIPS